MPSEETFTQLLVSPNVRIERIVSYGNVSPDGFWYDQEENEWVTVVEGEAKLEFEDKIVELKKGDYINLLARLKHRVIYTANPTIWLAIFYK